MRCHHAPTPTNGQSGGVPRQSGPGQLDASEKGAQEQLLGSSAATHQPGIKDPVLWRISDHAMIPVAPLSYRVSPEEAAVLIYQCLG